MLQVLGKIIAHYIISNDHAMPSSSIIEYIYVLDGKIGKGCRKDWLGCWEFFENSEIMFKDVICEEKNCINFSVFSDFVKNGENPFVSAICSTSFSLWEMMMQVTPFSFSPRIRSSRC